MTAIDLIEEFGTSIKNLLNKGTLTAKNTLRLQGKTEEEIKGEITKDNLGLSNVPNFPTATQQEAEEGIREDRLSTANSVGQFVDGVFTVNENALYFFTETNTPMAISAGSLATPMGLALDSDERNHILTFSDNPYNLEWVYDLNENVFYVYDFELSSWSLQPTVNLNTLLEVGRFYFNPYTNRLFFYDLNQNLVRF